MYDFRQKSAHVNALETSCNAHVTPSGTSPPLPSLSDGGTVTDTTDLILPVIDQADDSSTASLPLHLLPSLTVAPIYTPHLISLHRPLPFLPVFLALLPCDALFKYYLWIPAASVLSHSLTVWLCTHVRVFM